MAEPTAFAALALNARGSRENVESALVWLAARQQADGAVELCNGLPDALWSTPAILLSWQGCDPGGYAAQIARGSEWLLSHGGRTSECSPEVAHDPTIPGWSWRSDTSPWVEPTAMSILALRSVGRDAHARVADGLRLLRDRALPGGGWNYGNTIVLNHELRAFPDTTGLALLALVGTPSGPEIPRGLGYLQASLPGVRAGVSLACGVLALHAWESMPKQADEWLNAALAVANERPPRAHADALLLIAEAVAAGHSANPFASHPADRSGGQMVAA